VLVVAAFGVVGAAVVEVERSTTSQANDVTMPRFVVCVRFGGDAETPDAIVPAASAVASKIIRQVQSDPALP